jgi:DNA replication licensing factor MCM2
MQDRHLANFVVNSHIKHHPTNSEKIVPSQLENSAEKNSEDFEPLDQEILKKYIVYAKQNVHPKLNNVDQDKIAKLYSRLRQESLVNIIIEKMLPISYKCIK